MIGSRSVGNCEDDWATKTVSDEGQDVMVDRPNGWTSLPTPKPMIRIPRCRACMALSMVCCQSEVGIPSQTTIATSGTSARSPAAGVNIESFCNANVNSSRRKCRFWLSLHLMTLTRSELTEPAFCIIKYRARSHYVRYVWSNC